MHLWVTNLHPRSLLVWGGRHFIYNQPLVPHRPSDRPRAVKIWARHPGASHGCFLTVYMLATRPAAVSASVRRRLAGDGQASSLGTWRIGLPVGLQCCLPTCSLLCLHICCINLTASTFSVQAAHTCPNQRF